MRLWQLASIILAATAAAAAAVSAAAAGRLDTLDEMRARIEAARARMVSFEGRSHDPVGPRTWIDGSRLWYAETSRDGGRRWWLCDATKSGEAVRVPLFDHDAVAAVAGEAALGPDRLPIRQVAVASEDGEERVVLLLENREAPIVLRLGGGLVSAGDPSARATLEVPLQPARARSRDGGPSVHLTFENRLEEPLEIVWIDRAGAERSYGSIAPGASRRQQTYGGHAWLVRTPSGRDVGYVVAGASDGIVGIAGAATDERTLPDAERPSSPELEVAREAGNLVFRFGTTELFRTRGWSEADGFTGGEWIAPGGDAVVALRVRRTPPPRVHVVESAPKDRLQPKLRGYDYRKPGDPIDVTTPHLLRVDRAAEDGLAVREIALDPALFPNPWSLDFVRFLPGGREAALLYNQRGHQVVRLVGIDLETGAARTIAEESFPTFVDYTNKIWMHWLDATGELLWMTERDGWNRLALVDVAAGRVKRLLTEGPTVVRHVEHVDESRRTVDLAIMGVDPAQDPYHVHFMRVPIDGGTPVALTSGDGTCRVEFSPDRSALVSVRARADLPPVYELRRAADGGVVAELGRADDAVLRAAGWRPPERFVAKGRDGTTDVWGLVHRPSDFDPARRYPVIEHVYAGPHDHHVPKWFEVSSRAREYAELGAIVVEIDGMGTNWRSKAFHDVCWKNLKDAGFPDRILWLQALAARDPSVDLGRVGIYGGSAGGQNAMRAVLDHADLYRIAVADCGCHDNRMDKIWWNEQWMGWPVDGSYARNSNAEDAARLAGRLMLIVGALDDNVDPASTMQVVQRLVDAGKDFELLVIPDAGHGAAESEYGNLRRAAFLFRNLEAPLTSSDAAPANPRPAP